MSAATTDDDWARRALAAVIERVAVTAAEVGTRFPLYAGPGDGRWTTTGRGSWTGGFWAGLLWLRARHTGDAADRRAAAACTARLAPWVDADTATRGLILWYGTAPAGDDPGATALRERAARACLSAWDPGLGLLPWGNALGGPRLLARADGVPGTVPLLAGAGPQGAAAAAAHLHRHLDLCLGEDGPPHRSMRPAWRFDEGAGWQPCPDPPPGWSRGAAWLLLALADALLRPEVARTGRVRLDGAAEQLLAEGGGSAGPLVPPAGASRPDGPLDTSAAAITAVALLKLAQVPGPRAAAYADRAAAVLRRLARAHLTGPGPWPRPGSGPGTSRPAGMLLDGCYDAGKELAVRHELVWGDFFLALGLAALEGAVDITRV
ncbi:sugar ABC transporter permease [Streptomyces sp. NPDC048269]|uniref:sugar ABC transporter permease n=1 Tax=Streptomyces sp. NPDC048269 TaxID=3155753 RepID=UPI00342493D9